MGECLLRLRRLLLPEGNPLARPSDRLEGRMLALVLLLPLVTAPFAVVTGAQVHQEQLGVARDQERERRQVTATLLDDAGPPPAAVRSGSRTRSEVLATWHGPDGTVHTGTVAARAGAPESSRVRIWTDSSGRSVPPPMTTTAAVREGVAAAATLWLTVLFGSVGGFWLFHCCLDRLRRCAWQREWEHFERHWSGYRDSDEG
ncbi:hypothetical protein SAMN04487905_103126 [Actinopolyspora xinjiangensis]|uniref:Uncharacterized protein n=1 Tax=Actinopolyspora xinjiangensis TaxID=405564 RepID=A0A1H0RMQ9_9ACTN|nr:hypothetical protein [Actinopolyspora xinjiangensis]SDP30258.1 hypothetical protein SAMN04487905_103126 [Actinopolyspora xinjiangensis]